MNELKKLKKKYPSKKNEYGIINNDNSKIMIKNDTSNNIAIVQNKYDNINEILENNINTYNKKIINIDKKIKSTKDEIREKEIFLKAFSNNNYKQKLDTFILLRNKYIEKENNLQRQDNLLKELNKNINNYLIDLEKTEELFREDKFFL